MMLTSYALSGVAAYVFLPSLIAAALFYALAILMPDRRWLTGYGLIVLLAGIGAYAYDRSLPAGFERGELTLAIALAAVIVACLAGLLGVAIRAMTLYLRSRHAGPWPRAALAVAGFVLVLPVFAGPQLRVLWDERPPDRTCHYRSVAFSMAGIAFELPGLPFLRFTTNAGNEPLDDLSGRYFFNRPASLRRYCANFADGTSEVRPTSLSLAFQTIPARDVAPAFNEACGAGAASWLGELCHADYQSLGYPEELDLYLDGKYNAERMFAESGSTYDKIQGLDPAKDQPSELPGFRKNGVDYYFTADDGWRTPDGKPFAMTCFKSGARSEIFCRTGFRLKDDLYLLYEAWIDPGDPERSARRIYDKVMQTIAAMQRPASPKID